MSKYACKDIGRTELIEAHLASKDEYYYCQNPKCEAKLKRIDRNGLKDPYFRATLRRFSHNDDCKYYEKAKGVNVDEGEVERFDFEKAVGKLFSDNEITIYTKSGGGKSTRKVIKHKQLRTLKDIYEFLSGKDISEKISNNANPVGLMLLDERSGFMHPKGVWGKKLIRARFQRYVSDRKELHFLYDYQKVKFNLICVVESDSNFKYIRSQFYDKERKVFSQEIVIAGEWKYIEESKTAKCKISSPEQIHIIMK